MTDTRRAVRLLSRGAAPLVVWALVAGCGGGDGDAGSVSSTSAPGVTLAALPTLPPTVATATPVVTTAPATSLAPVVTTAPTPPPDGATVLQQALDQVTPGYHFVTNAIVNGNVVLTAEGDRVGTGTRMRLTSQGQVVDYVILPEGAWAAQNGEWQELEAPLALADPIAALRAPQSVTVVAHTPALTTLNAVYPGTAIGMPTDDPVAIGLELSGTTLLAIGYVAADGSSVRSDISALADTTPVTSPAD